MKKEEKNEKRKQCLIAHANKDTDYKMTEMNEMFDRVLRNKSGGLSSLCM